MNIDNPPAFPGVRNGPGEPFNEGMSLRDYMASKAMQGMIGGVLNHAAISKLPELGFTLMIKQAYDIADEMLKVRSHPVPTTIPDDKMFEDMKG